jgi:SlyX protein
MALPAHKMVGKTNRKMILGVNVMDQELSERLNHVEIKLSYSEDMLDQLNQTIFKQQQQIEFLYGEIKALKEASNKVGGEFRSLRDEIPPHY